MPRVCTVCGHLERDTIEDAFIVGTAKRRIAAQFGVSEQALRRHVREHLRLEGSDQYHAQLAAIREMRRNLELIAEVRRELDR